MSRRSVGLNILDDGVDVFRLFWRPRESVGDDVRLPLNVSDIRRVFGNVRQLVLLLNCLWVGFFVQRRNKRLVVCVERKLSTLEHGLEMAYALVGGQQLALVRRPNLLIGLQLGAIKS